MADPSTLRYRVASLEDVPHLQALIDRSVRELQIDDYTPAQIDEALRTYLSLDTQLIADQTYFVVENDSGDLIASGGWSKRRTLCGGDTSPDAAENPVGRDASLLDPARDAAKIRAFYVHPEWARRGIGSKILDLCENAARAAGFTRFEMGATLTGVPLYARHGYIEIERFGLPLPSGDSLTVVRMLKGN
ncbi:MAG: GNAT family N-acetyltransferase [Silvibacterium sp.]|nr:GNAT family N-acetyltransferase [Silvibacterium sp.]